MLTHILDRSNDVLGIDPPGHAAQLLSQIGTNWLWAVTAFFSLSFLGLLVFCFTAPDSDRPPFWGGIRSNKPIPWPLGLAANYSTLSTSTGLYPSPSAALVLGLLSGVLWTTILTNIGALWYWGFFGFGTLAYVILVISTLNESREAAERRGIAGHYTILLGWVNLLWLLCPVTFAVSNGGNVIGVTASYIFFGIFDMLIIPVLGLLFVLLGRKWDYGKLPSAVSEHRYVPT
ncbi:hypothetical protein GGR56DRAFT_667845 [Xylariaceae sp. FL0804]|nr:hypothetical protein GGR56DRAFT_667845 [Xylariaceae sp. FL0804]